MYLINKKLITILVIF